MPVFLLLLVGVLGAGIDGFYQLCLDDAVRDATRQVQMDTPAAASATGFIDAVCAEFGVVGTSCAETLSYDVQASTPASGFASLTPGTLGASGKLNNNFFTGTPFGPGVNLLVQVSYPLPFTLPFIATVLTGTGTNAILTAASARAEPYQ